jgi:hypothetical protein
VKVGDRVHYVSYGTPGGEYTSKCRAAIVAEVGQWVTVTSSQPKSFSLSEGRPIRNLEQWWFDDAAALVVLNPTGMFFNGSGAVACRHDETGHAGGTWHTAEACDA